MKQGRVYSIFNKNSFACSLLCAKPGIGSLEAEMNVIFFLPLFGPIHIYELCSSVVIPVKANIETN